MSVRTIAVVLGSLVALVGIATFAVARSGKAPQVSPSSHTVATIRRLRPSGRLIKVGNFPGGAALTADGRFLWTVNAGYTENGIQIVSTRRRRVVQRVKIPGASGGVALDDARHTAYVSGEPDTDITGVKMPSGTPGRDGDVIHVFRWNARNGRARHVGTVAVPPPSNAPAVDNFPPNVPPQKRSWPERLAVSRDGRTVLVALGLADAAAVIDTKTKAVRYVNTGSHPYGAAILPNRRTGLVSNRGPGTVSVN